MIWAADVPEEQQAGASPAGGVGEAAGGTLAVVTPGALAAPAKGEKPGQPERRTRFLMQRSTGQGGACLLPFLSELVLI